VLVGGEGRRLRCADDSRGTGARGTISSERVDGLATLLSGLETGAWAEKQDFEGAIGRERGRQTHHGKQQPRESVERPAQKGGGKKT